jgi:curved DNA-binding protein CbpA
VGVPEPRDPYRILQLHPDAVPQLVEAAYRVLARLLHPDRNPGPEAAAVMADLNWAYATLRDPEARMRYDHERASGVAIPVEPITPPPPTSTTLSDRVAGAVEAAIERDPENPANAVLDFGRFAGMSLRQIARIEPGYLEWLRRHSSGIRYRHQIDEVLGSLAARRTASVEQ